MLLLFVLLCIFFLMCLFVDVTIDEDNERQVIIGRNLTLIGGGILMIAVVVVALF